MFSQSSVFSCGDQFVPVTLGERLKEYFRFFRNFTRLTYVLSSRQPVKKTILDSVNSGFNAFYAINLFAVYSHKMAA